jgi:DNA polymerase
MTAEEKTVLARFLDTAGDYLGDGYVRAEEDYAFENDPAEENAAPVDNVMPGEGPGASSLPLAYLVAEDGQEEGDEEAGALQFGVMSIAYDSLPALAAKVSVCVACDLRNTRTCAVPGEGAERPLALVIGEGPGAEEDSSGRPFVGRAGQLLDRMLASIGLTRDRNCYIANVVKCRPPENRDPAPEEIAACVPYLEAQIRLLKPKVILCAGRVSARCILHTEDGINRLRGRFGEYPAAFEIEETGTLQSDGMIPVPVLPTYHPSAVLRDESLKRPAFEDLKLLMAKLAALDSGYRQEVKPLLEKYAAADETFAVRVREFLH